jgi:hypothetical protein
MKDHKEAIRVPNLFQEHASYALLSSNSSNDLFITFWQGHRLGIKPLTHGPLGNIPDPNYSTHIYTHPHIYVYNLNILIYSTHVYNLTRIMQIHCNEWTYTNICICMCIDSCTTINFLLSLCIFEQWRTYWSL